MNVYLCFDTFKAKYTLEDEEFEVIREFDHYDEAVDFAEEQGWELWQLEEQRK